MKTIIFGVWTLPNKGSEVSRTSSLSWKLVLELSHSECMSSEVSRHEAVSFDEVVGIPEVTLFVSSAVTVASLTPPYSPVVVLLLLYKFPFQ